MRPATIKRNDKLARRRVLSGIVLTVAPGHILSASAAGRISAVDGQPNHLYHAAIGGGDDRIPIYALMSN